MNQLTKLTDTLCPILYFPFLALWHIGTLQNNLLTHSTVQSPSWEANWFAASQEIPRISRNPKVHYRTHKRPLTVSILGQTNPVHIPTSHLLEIHPNIHPSTPSSPQWSLSQKHINVLICQLLHFSDLTGPNHQGAHSYVNNSFDVIIIPST